MIRTELYGERGGPELARRLKLPIRTWYNYEGGVTIPGEVLLKFVELTAVEPMWLLYGRGAKFRSVPPLWESASNDQTGSVEFLLRAAIQKLEQINDRGRPDDKDKDKTKTEALVPDADTSEGALFYDLDDPSHEPISRTHLEFENVRNHWNEAVIANRCVSVDTVAMAPLAPAGSKVVYLDAEEEPKALDGKMVVVWIQNQPILRWFQHTRNYILLRVDNPSYDPQSLLVDLTNLPPGWKVRRALYIRLPRE